MSKLPTVTGKELVAALGKAGFQVIRVQEATTSYATKTAVPQSFRFMPERPLGLDSSSGF